MAPGQFALLHRCTSTGWNLKESLHTGPSSLHSSKAMGLEPRSLHSTSELCPQAKEFSHRCSAAPLFYYSLHGMNQCPDDMLLNLVSNSSHCPERHYRRKFGAKNTFWSPLFSSPSQLGTYLQRLSISYYTKGLWLSVCVWGGPYKQTAIQLCSTCWVCTNQNGHFALGQLASFSETLFCTQWLDGLWIISKFDFKY